MTPVEAAISSAHCESRKSRNPTDQPSGAVFVNQPAAERDIDAVVRGILAVDVLFSDGTTEGALLCDLVAMAGTCSSGTLPQLDARGCRDASLRHVETHGCFKSVLAVGWWV
ncbi:hypothetical protein AB0K24_19715 [Streptomyces mirabilis]|uniref:hypothetical protein n=1 Tax=Streptomyces mirabilis TaxID=68239 RepID=UPI00341A18B0